MTRRNAMRGALGTFGRTMVVASIAACVRPSARVRTNPAPPLTARVVVDVERADSASATDASVPISDPVTWPARATTPPCAAIDRRNDEAILRQRGVLTAAYLAIPGVAPLSAEMVSIIRERDIGTATLVRCRPTPGGGWALLLQPREHGQWRFTAAHVDRAGNEVLARESGGPRAPSSPWIFDQRNDQWDESFLIIREASVFDFDGDGEPEFVLRQSSESRGGARTWLSAFRFVGGRAVAFPLPDGAQDLEDVDGDGRPDVVIEHRAFEWMSCETGSDRGTEGVEAPRTVARSLPGGTFSVRDPAVAAENLRECGPRPARIVARDADGVVDDEATARNVVCAGAWGVPRVQIVAALRTCRDFAPTRACDEEAMDARRTNECRHRRVLLEWAGWFP